MFSPARSRSVEIASLSTERIAHTRTCERLALADAAGQHGIDDKCRVTLQFQQQELATPIDRCKVAAHQMIGHLAAHQVAPD